MEPPTLGKVLCIQGKQFWASLRDMLQKSTTWLEWSELGEPKAGGLSQWGGSSLGSRCAQVIFMDIGYL